MIVDNIQRNVISAQDYIGKGQKELKKAERVKQSIRKVGE
jgi:hypothetical protein